MLFRSRWEGRRKPKNWAQTAPTPKWWTDALDVPHSPLSVAYRLASTLEQSKDAMREQYGRKLALYVGTQCFNEGVGLDEALMGVFLECCQKLKREDLAVLQELCPGANPEDIREVFTQWTNTAAEWTENECP